MNADDFGLTPGVNRGILEAHTRGIVTSATLMACGAACDEAVALSRSTPSLSVGCHVLLVDSSPILSFEEVSSFASSNSGSACFRESIVSFACLAATKRLREDQIEAETTAQIRKLQAAGIQVSHLDSHKHTHMFPAVFKPMLRAAKRCGIRAIRNPFEPLIFASTRYWKRAFQLGILRSFRSGFRRALDEAGLRTPDGCVGIAATGGLTQRSFNDLVTNLPQGTWEFVSHPGYNDADLEAVKTRLRASRERELAILTSQQSKELLAREKVDLISYRDFASEAGKLPSVLAPSGAVK